MTENVYVIRVKTKPPLSSLYPSERRYSASTVGGLSLVHFGLGALSLLLGIFALSLQGPILSVACMVPFVTGLLAWRRWYIDRNISIFFYGSLFCLVTAVLCFVVTIFDVAAVSGSAGGSLWPLEKILDPPNYSFRPADGSMNDTRVDSVITSSQNVVPLNITENQEVPSIKRASKPLDITIEPRGVELNESDFHNGARNNGDYDDLKAEASFTLEERTMLSGEILQDEGATNVTRDFERKRREKTFWHGPHYEDSSHTKILLTVNILVASLLEAFWSLLSARIAFSGMTNCLPENGNVVASSKTTRVPKRKPLAPKPDILDHDRRLSESLRSFNSLQGLAIGPRLPLPESSREFRERVERFLSNQATHGVVEGA